ncbi:ParA family protein [Saliphagus infecundisoli]|uniref:ParA family protein n=1 Tax=Saliphagus infecundisoli TaxID=1849069 RepID=A0ABD5QHE3_9EURY|nr:ParA family protein [Saliphagus infecundisoli]
MPITYTVYSESGGIHKTTWTANLAEAHARQGFDVLVIDLDHQAANLTYLFDVEEGRDDPDADNLVRHVLDRPNGDFDDLIQTTEEGVDVLPAHDMLEEFTELLLQRERFEENMGDDFDRYEQLYKVLWEENNVQEDYDVVIIDPNARAEIMLYNAIYATRTLVAPSKPAGKGNKSLDGLGGLLESMSTNLGIDVGVAAVILSGVGDTSTHNRYGEQMEAEYGVAGSIGKRESMMDEMWDVQGTAFKVVEEGWHNGEKEARRLREREVETLETILEVADSLANEFDVEPPQEPTLTIEDEEVAPL